MRKFNCDKYHVDVEYKDCCSCKHYNNCPTREVIANQRMFGFLTVTVFFIILLIITFSFIDNTRGMV